MKNNLIFVTSIFVILLAVNCGENNNQKVYKKIDAIEKTSNSDQTSSNAFLAIEDEPLIIDVSGISDSDGVGKMCGPLWYLKIFK